MGTDLTLAGVPLEQQQLAWHVCGQGRLSTANSLHQDFPQTATSMNCPSKRSACAGASTWKSRAHCNQAPSEPARVQDRISCTWQHPSAGAGCRLAGEAVAAGRPASGVRSPLPALLNTTVFFIGHFNAYYEVQLRSALLRQRMLPSGVLAVWTAHHANVLLVHDPSRMHKQSGD